MAYAIVGVLVVLLVAGFVIFMVLNATRKSGPAADSPREEGPPGIGEDETPLGDTTEHAGVQSEEGHTEDDPERTGFARVEPDDPHVARTGEAEGEQRIVSGTPPDRERRD